MKRNLAADVECVQEIGDFEKSMFELCMLDYMTPKASKTEKKIDDDDDVLRSKQENHFNIP